MRIEELHLKNFRCFEELDINFPESNLAVFIGLNGSGKTAILDAITLFLSEWRVFYFKRYLKTHIYNKEITPSILNSDICNGSQETMNSILASHCNKKISWKIDKNFKSDLKIEFNESCNKECEKTAFFISYKTNRKNDCNINSYCNNNFSDFERWFEKEENIENRLKLKKKDFNATNVKLDVVRKAIILFFSNIYGLSFFNLRVEQTIVDNNDIKNEHHDSSLVITCNEKELKLFQLSEGQKVLLNMVANIVFNLTRINHENDNGEYVNNILQSDGIVLIDEIELHLHPQWQREVLPALQKTFPNIQFIVTTHSPQVLSKVDKDDIFILKDNKIYQPSSNPIGRDSSDILEEIMGISARPQDIEELSKDYFSFINQNLFNDAEKVRLKLLEKLDPKDPIFIRADAIITRKKLLKR
ncbi:MAG: AAA family ATPase [Methylococcaceae bacterium]|nr:AAA family ATPase [Methylococcaceae bacterium]